MIISRIFEKMTFDEVKMMALEEESPGQGWKEVDRHWDDHILVIDTQGNDEKRFTRFVGSSQGASTSAGL